MLCSMLFSSWIITQEKEEAKQTRIFREKWMCRYFLPVCGTKDVTEISWNDIYSIFEQMSRDRRELIRSPAAYAACISFFQYAGIPYESSFMRRFREESAEIHPALPECLSLNESSPYRTCFMSLSKLYPANERTFNLRIITQKKHIFPLIGDIPVHEINAEHLQSILDKMNARHMAPKSIYTIWVEVKRIFNIALQAGWIHENPCTGFPVYSNDVPKHRNFPETQEEHEQLMQAFHFLPLADLFFFCYCTGMPFSKAQKLCADDIHLSERTCHIPSTKDTEVIPDIVFPLLEKRCQQVSEGTDNLFFPNVNQRVILSQLQWNLGILRSVLGIEWIRLSDITGAKPLKRFRMTEKEARQ